ncbi:Right handed beta helix region [uncultured archaeon]|nr:Right handed beta helix region [uncultured archaeon]
MSKMKKILILLFCLTAIFPLSGSGEAPCSYGFGGHGILVCSSGSNYYAKNSSTGEIISSGTNITTVVESVYSVLPRTGKSEIFFKGNFNVPTTISSNMSNLTLDFSEASFILNDNVNKDILSFIESSNVKIIGGFIDGNKDNQGGASSSGIRFYNNNPKQTKNIYIGGVNLTNISRYGIYIENFTVVTIKDTSLNSIGTAGNEGRGVYLKNGSGATIENIVGKNFRRYGILLNTVENGAIRDANISLARGDRGIYVFNSKNITISDCTSYENNLAGITFSDTYNSSVINCQSYNNTNDGLLIQGDANGDTNLTKNITVIGGWYHNNHRDGIRIQALLTGNVNDVKITGAYVTGNRDVGINLNSIDNTSINNIYISNNIIKHNNNSSGRGVRLYLSNNTYMNNNFFEDNNIDILYFNDFSVPIKN